MTFQNILVALDPSEQSAAVFAHALSQAQASHGALLLLHAMRPEHDMPMVGIGTLADVDLYNSLQEIQREDAQKARAKAEEWLQRYQEQAIAQGIATELALYAEEPGPLICQTALTWGADVVVVGRRGRQGLREVVLGSVSNYVVHHAPCAVLVVQGVAVPSAPASQNRTAAI
jgi:nucleotide-binding universal stress UspA family protein